MLGTLHGLDQSVSAAFRTAGPVIVGWWFGSSLEGGVVVAAWYVVPGVSLAGCASAFGCMRVVGMRIGFMARMKMVELWGRGC